MASKRRWMGVLTVLLSWIPLLAWGQIQIQVPPGWPFFPEQVRPAPPEHHGDEPRGFLEVLNDWEAEVHVTLWSHQRERIGTWRIPSGEIVEFVEDGHRIRVRPHYQSGGRLGLG